MIAVGLLPILVFWFQQYPIMSFLANLVAVPLVSMMTIPLVLTAIVLLNLNLPIAIFCLEFAECTLEILWRYLEWIEKFDFNLWHQPSPTLWILIASLIGTAILLQPRGLPARWIGCIWILPLIYPSEKRPDDNEFWFTLLDVGQGLSAVIQTRRHTLVYDTGAKFSKYFNAGKAIVVPYLRKQGVQHIDTLLISHGDNDHIGGAQDLLQAYPKTLVLTSVPKKIKHYDVSHCYAGQTWEWDGVIFEILHPLKSGKFAGNDNSCVLKISTSHKSVLLSGDIEVQGENSLLAMQTQDLSTSILIAPHHGSKTSSTKAFIDKVNPEYVLFPVGYRNRFKFPNQDIMSRYGSRGIKMLDTAQNGAILVEMHTAGMSVTQYRQAARRFWHTKF